MLFNALARTHAHQRFALATPLFACGMAAVACGIILGVLACSLFRNDSAGRTAFASRFKLSFRFNSYVGLSVLGKLQAAQELRRWAFPNRTMLPLVNLDTVCMLARNAKLGVDREMARNPLILATQADCLLSAALFGHGFCAIFRPI